MNLTNIIGQARFSERYGSSVTIAIAGGFAINLLLARLTRFKYIYLTGHMMFWTTMIFAGVMVNTAPAISAVQLTLMLTVIMGVYWTLQPALVQPWVRKITGNDNVALGHTSASVALLGAIFGQIFARNKISSEDIKVPKSSVLRDSNVVTALTMALLFFIGTFILQIKVRRKRRRSRAIRRSELLHLCPQTIADVYRRHRRGAARRTDVYWRNGAGV